LDYGWSLKVAVPANLKRFAQLFAKAQAPSGEQRPASLVPAQPALAAVVDRGRCSTIVTFVYL